MTAQLPSRRIALAGVFASLALAGCSSDKKSGGSDGTKRYATAQKKLAETAGYHVKVTSKDVPDDGSNLIGGEGDVVTKPASFKGKVTINTSGNQLTADVVSIEKSSWVKQGSIMKGYLEVDTADMGVPNPSALFSAQAGLPALPTKASELKESGQKLVDGEKVTMFKGTVKGADAVKLLKFGGSRADYTVEVGLTDKDELRVLTVTGPFFDAGNGTYTANFSNYGQKKTISQP